jgi:hypothetical protein
MNWSSTVKVSVVQMLPAFARIWMVAQAPGAVTKTIRSASRRNNAIGVLRITGADRNGLSNALHHWRRRKSWASQAWHAGN